MSGENNDPIGLENALNAAASMLVRLDPSDADGCMAVASEFRLLAASAGGSIGAPLAAAAVKLEAAAAMASGRDPLLGEAGKLFEQAMNIHEDAANAPPASPAPAPLNTESLPVPEIPVPAPVAAPVPVFIQPAQPMAAVPAPVPAPLPAPAPAPVSGPENNDDAPQPLPAGIDLDLMAVVITESAENLQAAEGAMLSLETNPADQEGINSVFRAFHTIKGITAFMGLTRMAELAHHSESLLSNVREGKIVFSGPYVDMSLRSVDILKELIQSVRNALCGQLMTKPAGYNALMKDLMDPAAAAARAQFAPPPEPPRLGDILVVEGKARREDVELADATKGAGPLGLALVRSEAASLTDVSQALRKQQEVKNPPGESHDSSVRVRTDRLDQLIETLGELVIAQSMLSQDRTVVLGRDLGLSKKVSHSGKIVRELQDLGMAMRMVPLKATFQKMVRVARDLSKKSGKEADISVSGEETEIDRNMVAVVDGLLVHMVRNSMDHGIEAPADREAAGKPRKGTMKLAAYHSGGNIIFEVGDDGKGLNKARICGKALERGLIKTADGMTDGEIHNLIFLPGFSTAEKITDVSGRGVGMDVVKKGVEELRGRIEISSEEGKGCTFMLKLPLTMAITDGLLVRVGSQRYIIPMGSIHILLRPEEKTVSTVTGRGELLNLRGELMPIFRMHRIFDVPDAVENLLEGLLVVVEDGDRHCALMVDELLGQQQVVAKAIRSGLEKTPGVSGGAILGDGRVGLILDPQEVAALGRKVGSDQMC